MKKVFSFLILCLSIFYISCSTEEPTDEEQFLETMGTYMDILRYSYDDYKTYTVVSIYGNGGSIKANARGLGMEYGTENYATYNSYLINTFFIFDKATSSTKGYYTSSDGEYKIQIIIYTSSQKANVKFMDNKDSGTIASMTGYFD